MWRWLAHFFSFLFTLSGQRYLSELGARRPFLGIFVGALYGIGLALAWLTFQTFLLALTPVHGADETQVIFLTSGTSWTVPSDWSDDDNSIEVIGGGGSSRSSFGFGGVSGGGGGGYSKSNNVSLTPEATVTYAVGAGGVGDDTTPGGDTWFCNSTTNCASITGTSVVVGAKGGKSHDGSASPPILGGQAGEGVGDVKYSGGNGGTPTGGGFNHHTGGGGAGGPGGDGKAGGSGSGRTGGGGAGGGSSTVGSSANGGAGGNGPNGTGAGAANGGAGSDGGGGGGRSTDSGNGGAGGNGTEWTATDMSIAGAGGGGGGGYNNGGAGGLYGGGAGSMRQFASPAADGAPGIIVITYTPATEANNSSNWFFTTF